MGEEEDEDGRHVKVIVSAANGLPGATQSELWTSPSLPEPRRRWQWQVSAAKAASENWAGVVPRGIRSPVRARGIAVRLPMGPSGRHNFDSIPSPESVILDQVFSLAEKLPSVSLRR